MSRDNIIRMAREAGSIDSEEVIETVWRAFSAAEREACAKVCETHTVDDVLVGGWHSAKLRRRNPRKEQGMTEDIIRMAREAKLLPEWLELCKKDEDALDRFVALVAAAEREACAAFLDRGVDLSDLAEHPAWQRYSADLLTACAAAIRARKP